MYFESACKSSVRELETEVKEKIIELLFGEVTEQQKRILCKFFDKTYNVCHCLALHYTAMEREREPEERRDFSRICDLLGLDPGRKEVILKNRHHITYFSDYASPRTQEFFI